MLVILVVLVASLVAVIPGVVSVWRFPPMAYARAGTGGRVVWTLLALASPALCGPVGVGTWYWCWADARRDLQAYIGMQRGRRRTRWH